MKTKHETSQIATVTSLCFDSTGTKLAAGSFDCTLAIFDLLAGTSRVIGNRHELSEPYQDSVHSVVAGPGNSFFVGTSLEDEIEGTKGGIKVFDTEGKLISTLEGHGWATNLAISSSGEYLASAGDDRVIRIWDLKSNRVIRILEGHTAEIVSLSFMPNSTILASRGRFGDSTVRIWNVESGACLAVIGIQASHSCMPSVAFHPFEPLLAVVGSIGKGKDRFVHLFGLDLELLTKEVEAANIRYVNAKVVLLGDTGVGKSGLSLVLSNRPFAPTESTPGRLVYTLDSDGLSTPKNVTQNRETLLWDLAGQPGYRIIHQLHLNEVSIALVVFDARSEIDPLAGVRHWERALRVAQKRHPSSNASLIKFLVSARNDRGGVAIGDDRLETVLREGGFAAYFKTSAKEGWQIAELCQAIRKAIPWDLLPEVSSSLLFSEIKNFLLEAKSRGQMLVPAKDLQEKFATSHPRSVEGVSNLRSQFETCIVRLENQDLIRRLTFGNYLLLQPELLDSYASAIVNAARDEPDGLGSVPEALALAGKFYVPAEQRLEDQGQEQLLLHAMVEELVKYDIALREDAPDGRQLVFPSQFNRDYEDAPEPKGKTITVNFDGPVQSLYSALVVRLGHSGWFTSGRAEMWRNAAIFSAKAGGKCGMYLQEFAEARGRLILFFDSASSETRFHFEEFITAHAIQRSVDGSVEVVRHFICPKCSEPMPESYVKRLLERGQSRFDCPCGGLVSLSDRLEGSSFPSVVEKMQRAANESRDLDAFLISARGETGTSGFQNWAGGNRVTLAIVFTDVVGSTALGEQIKDEAMNEIRRAHFRQSRRLIGRYKGREIKTIGDSFMAAFKSVEDALSYAINLQSSSGDTRLSVRAGIHIGPMSVEEEDVFGGAVNFAARVVGVIKTDEIWLSERAKEDLDRAGSHEHRQLEWLQHSNVEMKGFLGKFTLWSLSHR